MLDYIIVGSGLAGISFAEEALANNKKIVVFDNHSQNSTTVAGGLYNPVVLKRFTEVWKAPEQLQFLDKFYANLEAKLTLRINFQMPVYRKFYSVEEQNNWFIASDKPKLSPFLSTHLITKKYQGITAPFGFGEVKHSGFVDTNLLLTQYQNYLRNTGLLKEEEFDYSSLAIMLDSIAYKGIEAKQILFAEGFGLHQNPFFNCLPLDGTKGELLLIKAPDLKLDVIVNTSIFILPLGDGFFKVGATYNWEDKTIQITEEGKKELIEKLEEVLTCDYEIVAQLAGIRPTVKDRRPLVGVHPNCNKMYVLNGLGTRGVMIGPYLAHQLFQHIEYNQPIDPEADIKRFRKIRWNNIL